MHLAQECPRLGYDSNQDKIARPKNRPNGCPAKARILSRETPWVQPRHSPSTVCTVRLPQQRRSLNDRRGACQRSSSGALVPSCTSTVLTVWSTVVLSMRYSSIHVRYTIAIHTSYTLLWYRVCPRHLIVPGNLQVTKPDALHWVVIPVKPDYAEVSQYLGIVLIRYNLRIDLL